jgi:hypothetical protein
MRISFTATSFAENLGGVNHSVAKIVLPPRVSRTTIIRRWGPRARMRNRAALERLVDLLTDWIRAIDRIQLEQGEE